MLTLGLLAGAGLAAQTPAAPTPEAVQQGELLFSGQVRFAHRGPACIACHSVGGMAFPNGGTLGPDLTHVTSRIGKEGVQSALETLYFPAMVPLYQTRPLTPGERQALAAFLQHADATATPPSDTGPVAALAGILFLVLMLIAAWAGRRRLRGVRRGLLARARAAQAELAPGREGVRQ